MIRRSAVTILLCALAAGHTALTEHPPVVTTSQGGLRGQVLKSRGGRDFYSFTRVPYAKPPVGARRFMISEKADDWSGILDATQQIPECYPPSYINFGFTGEEDCLYLNVFSPNLTGNYPVIFSVHGGAFQTGSAAAFRHARYFMDEDVVFVGPNYRLGALGFLSLGDDVIPGNMGLKDQALALEWVQKEIGAFGGDRNKITLIGQSAGGVSADILCSAPRTNGIIKGCVSQSGVGLVPWAFANSAIARAAALNMAKAVGCDESDNLLECLQSKPVEQISDLTLMIDNQNNPYFNLPVIEAEGADGALLTSWPTGTDHSYPWIAGVCQDEGFLVTAAFELHIISQKYADKFIDLFNQTIIAAYNLGNKLDVFERIYKRFFKDGIEPIVAIRDYVTEIGFVYPALLSMSEHPGPTYFYKFNYTKGPHLFNLSYEEVPHSAELPYFYEIASSDGSHATAEVVALSKQLVKMWVNFARDQTPNSQDTAPWPQFQGQYYLDIQDHGISISNWTDYQDTLAFWKPIVSPSRSRWPSSWLSSFTSTLRNLFGAALS